MGGEGWGASKEEQASILRQKRADKIVMTTCILVQNVHLCKMCIMKELSRDRICEEKNNHSCFLEGYTTCSQTPLSRIELIDGKQMI